MAQSGKNDEIAPTFHIFQQGQRAAMR